MKRFVSSFLAVSLCLTPALIVNAGAISKEQVRDNVERAWNSTKYGVSKAWNGTKKFPGKAKNVTLEIWNNREIYKDTFKNKTVDAWNEVVDNHEKQAIERKRKCCEWNSRFNSASVPVCCKKLDWELFLKNYTNSFNEVKNEWKKCPEGCNLTNVEENLKNILEGLKSFENDRGDINSGD